MKRIVQEILSGLACLMLLCFTLAALYVSGDDPVIAAAQQSDARVPAKPAPQGDTKAPSVPVQATPLPVQEKASDPAPPKLTKDAEAEIWRINSELNELNTELMQLRARGAALSAQMRDAVDRGMKESKIDPEKWDVRITVDQRTQEQVLVVQAKPKLPESARPPKQ